MIKMCKKGKYIRKMLLLVLITFIIIIGSNLFVIMKINFTENKVGKVYFTNYYFVKANSEKMKIESFKEFMSTDDWIFVESYYETVIFRKGNLQKEIPINTLIKI